MPASDESPPAARPADEPTDAARWGWRLLRAALTCIGLLLLCRPDYLQEFETSARRFEVRLHPARPPGPLARLAIVRITDADYAELFDGRSPLRPERLDTLLRAIEAGAPAAIGVDLDTSTPELARLATRAYRVPVVWAREVVPCGADEADMEADGEADAPPRERCVLGPTPTVGAVGAVTFEQEADGSIQRYVREIRTSTGLVPSLPWALQRHGAPSAGGEARGDTVSRYIRFRRHERLLSLSAREVLALARDSLGDYRRVGMLRGRIVLLGGSYRAARDAYATPLAPRMLGVDILAQTLATEMEGGGVQAPRWWTVAALQIAVTATVLGLFGVCTLPSAFALTLLLAPPIVLTCSRVATGEWMTGWVYFVPLYGVLLVQQVYEAAEDYRAQFIRGVVHGGLRHAGAGPLDVPLQPVESAMARLRGWMSAAGAAAVRGARAAGRGAALAARDARLRLRRTSRRADQPEAVSTEPPQRGAD